MHNNKTKITKKIILVLFTHFSFLSFSQAPVIEWQKCLGGSNFEGATSIQPTTDGGYIVAGNTNSVNGDVSGLKGNNDFWVVKLNSSGTIEWQKCLGGSGTDAARDIKQTTDGGFIVCGYSTSSDGDVPRPNSGIDENFWIVKLNNVGTIEWQKSLGGTGKENANNIEQTTDGGYIVVGSATSFDGDVLRPGFGNDDDVWVVKLNNLGSVEWKKLLGGDAPDYGNCIKQTVDGGYIIAGNTSSTNRDVSINKGFNDLWLVKLSNSGNIEWQKSLGGSDIENAKSIELTSDGGYIVAGNTASNNGDVSGNKGQSDIWIVKLNSIGTIQWQKCLGGSNFDSGNSIKQTKDGGYIVAGRTESNDGDVIGFRGAGDFWIVKLNNIGIIEWQKCLGGTGSLGEHAFSIHQTANGGYIVAGYTYSDNGDVTGFRGMVDAWVVKLSAGNLSTIPFETSSNIIFSPNPIRSIINFSQDVSELQIFNIDGKYIKSFQNSRNNFDVSTLEKGIYILKGKTKSGKNINEKLIKE